MHIRDDNTEMDVKETSFVVDLILQQNEWKAGFWKS